ncbi:MAG TPA: prolyl oligopeptidase family serine peptidase [Anaeromyxobacter sp.]
MLDVLLALAVAAALAPPPKTPARPVVDTYHGSEIADPYRWLEDGKSPEVREWSREQDARTRSWLRALPDAAAIRARTRELLRSAAPRWFAVHGSSGPVFALEHAPPRQQSSLVVFGNPAVLASKRAVVDPLALDPSGKTAIDFYAPSPNGRLVAVSLSQGGTEEGALSLYDVATGKPLPDRIPRVNGIAGGGSVAWLAGGESFLYTRYPREGERPAADLPFFEEVWLHRVGEPDSKDVYVLGRECADPRIAEHFLRGSDDGHWAADLVQKGDGGEYELFVRSPSGAVTRVAELADRIVAAQFGEDGALYLLSRKDAPRGKILRLPLEGEPEPPSLARAKVAAEASRDGAIEAFESTRLRLFIVEIVGGPSRVRVIASGRERPGLPLLPVSTVREIHRTIGGGVVLQNESFLEPSTWLGFDEVADASVRLPISTPAAVDFSDAEVVRDFAVSKDGTKVPLSIVRRKGTKLDGRSPAILFGYGGYGISMVPSYSPLRRLWLDAGVVFVVAHVRGGAEYGDAWHKAGNLTHKQNVFDDFAAAAQRLFETKVTSPERLALLGGSNGGLLVGATVTQHPSIARAAVAQVGVFDMLRVELHPNGAFNVTEFGTVKDPEQFRALRAYSPLHHVKDGTKYPAILLTAGDADPRVDAYHARKMAARLQAASATGRPILLRVSGFGHGMGSPLDEIVDERADVTAFLLHELGVRFRPGGRTRSASRG